MRKITKNIITRVTVDLSRKDIIEFLKNEYSDVPDNCSVVFHVPGGGDWSNTQADVTEENPVSVSWEVSEIVEE